MNSTRRIVALALFCPLSATASDPENCLSCHRFHGLARIEQDTGELHVYSCRPEYYAYALGPHARLRCTGCHERDEYRVVPHQPQTPVDCARTCHVRTDAGLMIEFSHRRVQETLDFSAHSLSALSKLEFDPPLLRPGQSTCLYCHDEPVFRTSLLSWCPTGETDSTRCTTCHGPELPVETTYFTKHILSRLQRSRPVRQQAQVCGLCHSDPLINAQIDGHDAVSSYFNSFHGKASLLGSHETATCMDCHASTTGNAHAMLSAEDPASTIHVDRLPNTCRSTACHPGSPPSIGTAAVHLDLHLGEFTFEFAVASVFVLLTAGVMLVFFCFIMLELVNTVIRGRDPAHAQLVELARTVRAHPQGRVLIQRMNLHERIQHWIFAISFTVLVFSGMPIKFAKADWAATFIPYMGGLTTARWLHRVFGVLLIVAFFYHLVYVLAAFTRRVKAARASGDDTSLLGMLFSAKLVLTPNDVKQFFQLFAYLLFMRRHRPHFPYFNFMQKFEYWAVFWGMPVMGISGYALWGRDDLTEFVSGRALNFAFIIHSDEAYLAFIYIAVVHMFSVIFAPVVFPLSLGAITGQAPVEEVAEGHSAQLEYAANKLSIPIPPPPPKPRGLWPVVRSLVRRTYAAGLCAAVAMLCYSSMHFLVEVLFSHDSTPADVQFIPKRLEVTDDMRRVLAQAGSFAPGEQPRGPVAHYHQLPAWSQSDPQNWCTTCHVAAPHHERVEVRSFLNMHGTFLDCAVCHNDTTETTSPAWLSMPDRRPRDVPGLLRLEGVLTRVTPSEVSDRRTYNAELTSLLREILNDITDDLQLRQRLLQLETTHIDSVLWSNVVESLRRDISMMSYAQYHAKIGLFANQRMVGSPSAEQRAAAETMQAAGDDLVDTERQRLHDIIHRGTHLTKPMCSRCHDSATTEFDLAALGYAQRHISRMHDSLTVKQISHIESGESFVLPLTSGLEDLAPRSADEDMTP